MGGFKCPNLPLQPAAEWCVANCGIKTTQYYHRSPVKKAAGGEAQCRDKETEVEAGEEF